MTSITRYTASQKNLPNPDGVVVLTYSLDGDDAVVPFIFDKKNLVLDFDFSGSFSESTSINSSTTAYVRGQSYGADQVVLGIGPNMISWLETTGGATAGSVKVYELPVVCRANQLQVNQEPNSINAMSTSTSPFSFDQSAGSESNRYFSTYIFKKPLVVEYDNGGTLTYRVFTTQFSAQT